MGYNTEYHTRNRVISLIRALTSAYPRIFENLIVLTSSQLIAYRVGIKQRISPSVSLAVYGGMVRWLKKATLKR